MTVRAMTPMASRRSQTVVALLAIVILLMGAAGLQARREARYPPAAEAEASLAVTSGTALRHLTAGYNAAAADLYWIRAIQYYGDVRLRLATASAAGVASQTHLDYQLLYPMLDLTTTLDPRFNIAYRFGSIFLAEPFPGGAGRPDLAVALLEKGLREQPDKWEYMQDIGFVHYWWRHDYQAAAAWFTRASQVPGAPWWLKSLAATTLAEGGDRQSSRAVWEAIRDSAEIDWLRHDAERRLLQLQALDQIDALQKTVDALTARTGHAPAGWRSAFSGIPVDPSGTPYEIDTSGRVHLGTKSPLFPLPDEPKALPVPVS